MWRGSVEQTHSTQGKCLEIVGMPSSVNINDLQSKVCKAFDRIGVALKQMILKLVIDFIMIKNDCQIFKT